jgi:hypothetical protein
MNPYNPDDLPGGLSVAPLSPREEEQMLHEVYEAGADAMLEALKAQGQRTQTGNFWAFDVFIEPKEKGWLIFIEDTE